MKQIITIVIFLFAITVFSQNKNAKASLEVDGVCMMCKERIEKAAVKTKGVKSAIWSLKTHELQLIYDDRKTNIDAIKTNIVAVGHDTKELKATDEAYNSVHPCCKYRDDDLKVDHNN